MGFKRSSAHQMHAKQCLSSIVYRQVQKIFSVVLKLDIIAYTNMREASVYLAGIMRY